MSTPPRKVKKFEETAGARADLANVSRAALSELVGTEIRVHGWEMTRSSFGEYAILDIQRHGSEREEVKTSSRSIITQLNGMGKDDWPFDAWVLQAAAPEGMTGRLYFGGKPGSVKDAPVGEKGN